MLCNKSACNLQLNRELTQYDNCSKSIQQYLITNSPLQSLHILQCLGHFLNKTRTLQPLISSNGAYEMILSQTQRYIHKYLCIGIVIIIFVIDVCKMSVTYKNLGRPRQILIGESSCVTDACAAVWCQVLLTIALLNTLKLLRFTQADMLSVRELALSAVLTSLLR